MAAASHVVIGSGINALVAAAMLALKGDRVTVLEREEVLGGCARTGEITLPGFRHDVMAATWVLFLTGPAHGALGKELARHGLDFCHSSHPTAVARPDGSSLVLTMERARNVAALNALAPGDGDRHAEDCGTGVERDAPFLFGLLGRAASGPGRPARMRGPGRPGAGRGGLAGWIGGSPALLAVLAWRAATGPNGAGALGPWGPSWPGPHARGAPTPGQDGQVIAFLLERPAGRAGRQGLGRAGR
jgi:phytoene dehydrogenase-like protein